MYDIKPMLEKMKTQIMLSISNLIENYKWK
jgi:hypothetical protein